MKKETLILVALAAAAGFYFYTRKKPSGLVSVQSPEIITERDFMERKTTVNESPIEKVTKVVQSIFPKRTAEQKAAKRLERKAKRTARKQKVAGFDNVLY